MAWYGPGLIPNHPGDPPPEWEPLPIWPDRLALLVTVIAVVVITLLIILTLPGGEVTESPSPMTTEELLSGMVTEEVEPGVYRVIHDGVRDLAKVSNTDIVAGHDGGIWLLREHEFLRLGGHTAQGWGNKKHEVTDFEVAPDGTVWWVQKRLISFHGEERWAILTGGIGVEVMPDGIVWTVWLGRRLDADRLGAFGYQDADGYQHDIGDVDPHWTLMVAESGDIWARGDRVAKDTLFHWVDGAWHSTERSVPSADIGPEGTVWGVDIDQRLVRFDGGERTEWPLDGTGFLTHLDDHVEVTRPPIGVARDGSVWLGGLRDSDAEEDACGGGVGHFDGVTWDRHLADLCVGAIDIAADGSVWLLAGEKEGRNEPLGLYVITPEAVAATE